MIGFAHLVLHLGLCNAAAKVAPETPIPIRVHLSDATGRQQLNQAFNIERGYDPQIIAEMDVPRGTFQAQISSPKYRCSATDYLVFLSERNRNVSENLSDGTAPPTQPVLLAGTAPQAFLYVKPTFVLFDKATTDCNKPITDPIPIRLTVENDQDAFYVWLYNDPSLAGHGPMLVAFKLGTATGQFHYIKIPTGFPLPWRGWPETIEFNVTEDVIDSLSGQPVNVLLCPKIYTTSVG
jgi:hypothetical protein